MGLPELLDKVQRRRLGELLLVLSTPRDTSPQCLAKCEPLEFACQLETVLLNDIFKAAALFSDFLGQG